MGNSKFTEGLSLVGRFVKTDRKTIQCSTNISLVWRKDNLSTMFRVGRYGASWAKQRLLTSAGAAADWSLQNHVIRCASQSATGQKNPIFYRKDRVEQFESQKEGKGSGEKVPNKEEGSTELGKPGGPSVVEQVLQSKEANQLTPPHMKDGEILLFQTRKPMKYKILVITGAIPGVFGLLELGMNLSGAEYPLPAWQIAVGIGSSIVLYGMSWRAMRGEIESMVLCDGGAHVRMRPFNIAGRPGSPDVTVPIRLLREKKQPVEKASKARLFTMEGDKDPGQQKTMHHMILDFRNDEVYVHDSQVLDAVLQGRPMEIRQSEDGAYEVAGPKKREDPSIYWKKAEDANGKEYWWHEITRETRWEPPF